VGIAVPGTTRKACTWELERGRVPVVAEPSKAASDSADATRRAWLEPGEAAVATRSRRLAPPARMVDSFCEKLFCRSGRRRSIALPALASPEAVVADAPSDKAAVVPGGLPVGETAPVSACLALAAAAVGVGLAMPGAKKATVWSGEGGESYDTVCAAAATPALRKAGGDTETLRLVLPGEPAGNGPPRGDRTIWRPPRASLPLRAKRGDGGPSSNSSARLAVKKFGGMERTGAKPCSLRINRWAVVSRRAPYHKSTLPPTAAEISHTHTHTHTHTLSLSL
jgi:hypothetical protein